MAKDLKMFALDIRAAGDAKLVELVPVGNPAELFSSPNDVKKFAMAQRMDATRGMSNDSGVLLRAQQMIDRWEEETILRLFPVTSKG